MLLDAKQLTTQSAPALLIIISVGKVLCACVVVYTCTKALFSSKIFCKIDTVALSFVFDKYYLIMY